MLGLRLHLLGSCSSGLLEQIEPALALRELPLGALVLHGLPRFLPLRRRVLAREHALALERLAEPAATLLDERIGLRLERTRRSPARGGEPGTERVEGAANRVEVARLRDVALGREALVERRERAGLGLARGVRGGLGRREG